MGRMEEKAASARSSRASTLREACCNYKSHYLGWVNVCRKELCEIQSKEPPGIEVWHEIWSWNIHSPLHLMWWMEWLCQEVLNKTGKPTHHFRRKPFFKLFFLSFPLSPVSTQHRNWWRVRLCIAIWPNSDPALRQEKYLCTTDDAPLNREIPCALHARK